MSRRLAVVGTVLALVLVVSYAGAQTVDPVVELNAARSDINAALALNPKQAVRTRLLSARTHIDNALAAMQTTTTTAVPTTTVAPTTTAVPTTTQAPTTTIAPTTTVAPTTTTTAPGTFPNASNTGIPAGTVLTPSGSITVNTAGTVIDAKDVTGTITINANNVTVKRTRVTGANWWIIRVADNVTGTVIEDCEIDGRGLSGNEGTHGIQGQVTVRRCDIWNVEDGIVPFGNGLTIEGNYIHGLASPGAPHYDGIEIDGGASNMVIRNNTVINDYGQTAAIMIDNYFGSISNISVTGNRLIGGGYTVYSDGQFSGGSITGVSFTSNRMKRGQWGYGLIRNNTVTWSGNVDDVTGAAVPNP